MENDRLSIEATSEFIDDDLSDAMVAIFRSVAVEITNKKKKIEKKVKLHNTYFNYNYQNQES